MAKVEEFSRVFSCWLKASAIFWSLTNLAIARAERSTNEIRRDSCMKYDWIETQIDW
jgi:hypothetical protein